MNLKQPFTMHTEKGIVEYPNITIEVVDPEEMQKLWDNLDKKYSLF